MSQIPFSAEDVFARAIEMPAGAARDEFVRARCENDSTARRDVESLLRAHDTAGDFLRVSAGASTAPASIRSEKRESIGMPAQPGTAILNAAAYADGFLRDAGSADGDRVEAYVGTLPEGFRREVRERIEAGLRVRQFRRAKGRPREETEEAMPQLPGFRVERKLGRGSLGAVYAAHDEKLN